MRLPCGTTYVYENISYWDKEAKKTRHRRKCIGKIDPDTKQIVPTGKKTDVKPDDALRKSEQCRVLTIGSTLLLDKAATKTKLAKVLSLIFPEDYEQILTCAYYLASEGKALCHAEQWSSRNKHPYGKKLPDQRISELLARITPSKQQDFFSRWADLNHDSGYYALDMQVMRPCSMAWRLNFTPIKCWSTQNLRQISKGCTPWETARPLPED